MRYFRRKAAAFFCLAVILFNSSLSSLQAQVFQSGQGKSSEELDLLKLSSPESRLRGFIERYMADRGSLSRFYTVESSPTRREKFRGFYRQWLNTINKLDFATLRHDEQVDYLLFKNYLDHELRQAELRNTQLEEMKPLLPFAETIIGLEESRRRMEKMDSQKVADLMNQLGKQIDATRKAVEQGLGGDKPGAIKTEKTIANRAVFVVNDLRRALKNWSDFYNGYDPLFTWWMAEPYKVVDQSLQSYGNFLRERIVGVRQSDNNAIIGNPIGRDAIISELEFEMIPYTPEDLIAIAEKEFVWCETEMKKASRELGFGDDWKKALEHVKNLYVEPGKQTEMVKELALEAIEYVDKHDLVTVPQLARETWRMEMLSPQQQLVSPFFLGGETIQVSYPTNTMPHEAKLMSMRGNNPHFSKPTVQHELFPGHGLQQFMTARYRPYRQIFGTPFWTEGWALYWEFLLWDMKFPTKPEDKVGFLFWRMHRCARIIFSLSFHLGKMTPQQCIDLLVNRVGHEVDNATAEVRRSFGGNYGPMYQVAYMLGGLQFYSLHRELVDSGKMKNREFHDAILKEGRIPVEMVRAILTKQKLSKDFKTGWKFYGENPGGR
ncbi:MAG: DUF885 family protein [Blastocatellales bacterium]